MGKAKIKQQKGIICDFLIRYVYFEMGNFSCNA